MRRPTGNATVPASEIVQPPRPNLLATGLIGMWSLVGIPLAAQFDNHSTFRGGIPPASASFCPVVATCLDLGVVPRFIPLREPWRNGVVERFNDVWDKSFFGTERFRGLEHLRDENAAFIAFHNVQDGIVALRRRSIDEGKELETHPSP
jgi:hypothetical protein